MKLNDKMCKNAKPSEKARKLFDGAGLYLEVTPKGSKLWRFKYRYLGKEKKLCIGEYPIITLAEARNHREDAKRLLVEGLDPSSVKQEKKIEKALDASHTFEVIAREWHKHKAPEWSETNATQIIKRLEKDVFPIIGKYPIKDITHKKLLDLASSVKERGAHELAKRIVQMCKDLSVCLKTICLTGGRSKREASKRHTAIIVPVLGSNMLPIADSKNKVPIIQPQSIPSVICLFSFD